ncbi:MAG: hypothetical protein AB2A00_40410 [Myxococcota bacterium]
MPVVALLLGLTALGACGSPPWEQDAKPPDVQGLEPNRRPYGEGGATDVHGSFLKPSYNAFLDEETPLRVRLSDRELEVLEIDPGGHRATVLVPNDLPPGLHDVTVINGYGQDVLTDGYLVSACDGGPCP